MSTVEPTPVSATIDALYLLDDLFEATEAKYEKLRDGRALFAILSAEA
jgi:hypothetical protein